MFKKKLFSAISLMMAMAIMSMLPACAKVQVSTSSSQSSSTGPVKVVQLDVFSASAA